MLKIEELYTVKDLENIFKMKKDKVYKLVHTNGFPSIIIGKNIRVPKSELEKWIKKYSYSKFIV